MKLSLEGINKFKEYLDSGFFYFATKNTRRRWDCVSPVDTLADCSSCYFERECPVRDDELLDKQIRRYFPEGFKDDL